MNDANRPITHRDGCPINLKNERVDHRLSRQGELPVVQGSSAVLDPGQRCGPAISITRTIEATPARNRDKARAPMASSGARANDGGEITDPNLPQPRASPLALSDF
jgi:hypothetical protein